MSELIFPASLKPIVNKGYSQTRGGNIWRSDVLGGLPRQGRDTYYDSVPIGIALVVSALGRQAFWSFITQISGGADSFQMMLDTGMGLEYHNVQITSDIAESTDTGVFWNIQFTATAERTSIQEDNALTAILPDLYGIYGDNVMTFFDAYSAYCSSYPFVNGDLT